jgi:hypothetical protein
MRSFLKYFVGVLCLFSFEQMTYSQYPNNFPLTRQSGEQSECAVGISPLNADHVVVAWNDYRNGAPCDIGWAITLNGGVSWDSGWFADGIDPSCGFDNHGNVFVAYYIKETYGGSIWVEVKPETSTQWAHKLVHWGASVDKPMMAIDNSGGQYDGRVYITWHSEHSDATEDSVLFSFASSAANSFVSPILLDSIPGVALRSIKLSMPVVDADGRLYISWSRMKYYQSFPADYDSSAVVIVSSTNGGSSFSQLDTVTRYTHLDTRTYFGAEQYNSLRMISIPMLAAARDGRVYLALWTSTSYTDGTRRIKWFRSTDAGSSWTSADTIARMGGGLQFHPAVTTSDDGDVIVTYMHSPSSYPGSYDSTACFLIRSMDNGLTFSEPIQLSDRYSRPYYSSDNNYHFEYIGVAAAQGK